MVLSNVPAAHSLFRYAPHSATLHITDNCFFRCIMCDQWKTNKTGELSTNEWKAVISQLKAMEIRHVSFAGGEVFMRKDLFELLGFIKGLGMSSSLITNGFVLDRAKLEGAVSNGLGAVGISLDAVGAEFDEVRGVPGASKRVVEACGLLAEYKATHAIEVHLYFTLMSKTLASYREVFALARSLGFVFVVNLFDYTPYFFKEMASRKDEFWIDSEDPALSEFQRFLVSEKARSRSALHALFSEIRYFKDYFKDPIQKETPCLVSQNRLGIDSSGRVYGGCWSKGAFGSVKQSPLKDIVASPAYRSAHRDMFQKNCPGCSCGYSENLRHRLRYRATDLAYTLVPALRERIWK